MRTSRQSFAQNKTRYGRSGEINQNKLSESFFMNQKLQTIKKFNTISQISQTNQGYQVNMSDDERINTLIAKNERFRVQIKKIQKVLNGANQLEPVKPEYGVKLPEIRGQVADRQLENAYKQIKHYQYEIQKLKSLQNQGTYAVRLTKAERSIKQKQELRDKLKIQLQKLQKSSKSITKSLIDDRTKILLENKSKKLNDQLKMYQKKWGEDQRKKNFSIDTYRKRKDYILQLERKLFEAGVVKTSIQQTRRRVFEAKIYRDQKSEDESQEEIEDRTPQAYKSLLSELKLLKKVTVTNQKLHEKIDIQKDQFTEKNRKTKIKLDETQKEIQIIENQITFLKKHVDPQKFKPKIKVQGPLNSRVTFNSLSISQDNSISDPYANRDKGNLEHHFQFVQIGVVNPRSEKFNDRKLLGKRSSKIVGVELFQNRMQLLGYQFTYQVKEDQKLQGILMQVKNQNQRFLQKKELYLDSNDYFATIQCFFNSKNFVSGIILISQSGKVIKSGNFQGNKRFLQMNSKQYPACVYSCIGKLGIELIGVQKVQPQAF